MGWNNARSLLETTSTRAMYAASKGFKAFFETYGKSSP